MCEFIKKMIVKRVASKTPTRFLPLHQIKTMLVLIDANGLDKDECMKRINGFCNRNHIELTVIYVDFINKKGDEKTIALSDIGLFGIPSMKKTGYVLGKWFDLYVSLTDSSKFCVRYLTHIIDAKMKVGSKALPGDPYEITVVQPLEENAAPVPEGQPAPEPVPVSMTELFGTIENILTQVR